MKKTLNLTGLTKKAKEDKLIELGYKKIYTNNKLIDKNIEFLDEEYIIKLDNIHLNSSLADYAYCNISVVQLSDKITNFGIKQYFVKNLN